MSTINFSVKSGKQFYDIALHGKPTVKELKVAFSKLARKDINRISLKAGEIRLDDDSKSLVDDYNLGKGGEITFKDLGPQIGYRTVFLVEYFGPMLFVFLYYLRPAFIYGADAHNVPYHRVALTGVVGWILHFLKRELETLFVHKFSRPTMPLSNLVCVFFLSI